MAKIEKGIIISLSILMTMISVLFFSHLDLEYISTWGVSLLEHIQDGNLSNYAIDLFKMNYGTNYNLFQNMNVAIWCFVPYLLSQLILIEIPMFVYQTVIKTVVAIIHIICAKEIYKIIKILGFNNRKAFISAILYFLSPFIMIHAIGIGQIDCLGIFFFLLSIRYCLEKKYWRMSLVAGCAILSKFFVLFIYVPWILLNCKNIKKWIKYLMVIAVIPLFDKLVTFIFIDNYGMQANVHNADSFYPRLFTVSINYESIVLFIILCICGLCFLYGNRGKSKNYYYLIFPSIIFFVFFLFVFWHPQWSIYVFPIILIMGCYISNEWEYFLFYTGYIYGFSIYSLVKCNTSWFNAIIMKNSFIGQFYRYKQTYIGCWIEENLSKYSGELGYTIYMASFMMLIVTYYFNISKNDATESQLIVVPNTIWYIMVLFSLCIYYVMLFLKYFGIIN